MAIRSENEIKTLRPSWLRARLAKWALMPYRLGLGILLGKKVMLLTTTGRVTGRERRTPLWYLRQGDIVYSLSGWGSSSDWFQNLKMDPDARIQIGRKSWETRGMLIQGTLETEKTLKLFLEKYGRRTVGMFYHLDRLCLVAFPLSQTDEMTGVAPPAASKASQDQ